MLRGETVAVLRPLATGSDAFGAPTVEWEREEVADVLVAPSSTSDLGADRPEGSASSIALHFPKSYAKSLRGCRVEALGGVWEVSGDPAPFMGHLTPGRWNREAEAVRIDG